MNNESMKQLKKANMPLTNEELDAILKRNQTIVVSDLHAHKQEMNALMIKMRENPNLHIIILGDVTDRGIDGKGTDGIEMLIQCMQLQENGKIDYIPGNHDQFLYNYLRGNDNIQAFKNAERNLNGNKGQGTIRDIQNFNQIVAKMYAEKKIKKLYTKNDLTKWLGERPLQMLIEKNNNKYALAHAIFDIDLFMKNPMYNLQDLYKETRPYDKNILWYRESGKDGRGGVSKFPNHALNPKEGWIYVVGHTVQKNGINMRSDKNYPGGKIIYIDDGTQRGFTGLGLEKCEIIDLYKPTIDVKRALDVKKSLYELYNASHVSPEVLAKAYSDINAIANQVPDLRIPTNETIK